MDQNKIKTFDTFDFRAKCRKYIRFGLLINHSMDWKFIWFNFNIVYARYNLARWVDRAVKVLDKKEINRIRFLDMSNKILRANDDFMEKIISKKEMHKMLDVYFAYLMGNIK